MSESPMTNQNQGNLGCVWQANERTCPRNIDPAARRHKEPLREHVFLFARCVAVGPPAEWRTFLFFSFCSDPWRMRGVCAFHESVWTTGRPIPLRGLLYIVAKLLFWCSGSCSDEMLRLQGRIQWHVNCCVLVFNLSLSPGGFSRELFYSVPLCCALSFGRCSTELCVCDFHTTLFHVCLAPLCFTKILRTLSSCRVGCVFTAREDLHVTAGTKKFPSRGDQSSCCRVDNQHW